MLHVFEMYCSKFNAQPVINKCKYHKAFTAAYLFVISDRVIMLRQGEAQRAVYKQQVASRLGEGNLSKEELSVFGDAVDLLSRVFNNGLTPRCDWCACDENEPTNPFYDLYVCYGDLLYAPDCLANYQRADALKKGIEEDTSFSKAFKETYELSIEYVKRLVDL